MRYFYNCLLCVVFLCETPLGAQPEDCRPVLPDEQYVLGPDSQPQGVPEGKVAEHLLKEARVFPAFEHRWWLYVPAQYDGETPLALMVFPDGLKFVARDGSWRVPVVLNNLIAKKALPLMAAVFIDPGQSRKRERYEKAPDGSPLLWETYRAARFNHRSVEYEPLNPRYANFLVDELLPEVRRHVRITADPNGRGIGGESSSGNVAFTVAWHRPDQFRKVFSAIGAFPVTVQGAKGYPQLVRESEPKPIRAFFQSGALDKSLPMWGAGKAQ